MPLFEAYATQLTELVDRRLIRLITQIHAKVQQRAALEEQQAAVQAARKKYQELVKAARAAEAHEAQARATLKATLAKHAMQSA